MATIFQDLAIMPRAFCQFYHFPDWKTSPYVFPGFPVMEKHLENKEIDRMSGNHESVHFPPKHFPLESIRHQDDAVQQEHAEHFSGMYHHPPRNHMGTILFSTLSSRSKVPVNTLQKNKTNKIRSFHKPQHCSSLLLELVYSNLLGQWYGSHVALHLSFTLFSDTMWWRYALKSAAL